MQFSVIKTRAAGFMSDPNYDFSTEIEVGGWVNDAYHELEMELEYTEVSRTESTVASQQKYSLPSGVYKPEFIYWEDDPLNEKTREDIVREYGAQNLAHYSDPEVYWLRNNDTFYLYPIPSTSASTATVSGSHSDSVTTITVDSTAGFPDVGSIKIESEVIAYTNITSTTFTGCVRAQEGTTAATHADTSTVTERDISIDFYGTSTDLSADADVPNLPLNGHIALAYYAASIGLLKAKSLPEAKRWKEEWLIAKENTKRKYRLKRTNYPSVKDAGSWGLGSP